MPDTYTLTVDGHPLVVNVDLELEPWDYVYVPPQPSTRDYIEDDYITSDYIN